MKNNKSGHNIEIHNSKENSDSGSIIISYTADLLEKEDFWEEKDKYKKGIRVY